MAQVAGITMESTYRGIPTYARINENKSVQVATTTKTSKGKCPAGYMTHEEFVGKCNEEIDDLCSQYGILQ